MGEKKNKKSVSSSVVQQNKTDAVPPLSTTTDQKDKKEKHYGFGIFLIFVGIILVLNNLGVVKWDVWLSIVNFWPLFIILAGMGLILGTSRAGKIASLVLTSLLYIFIILVVVFSSIPEESVPQLFKNFRNSLGVIKNADIISENKTIEGRSPDLIQKRSLIFDWTAGEYNLTDYNELYSLDMSAKYFENRGIPVLEESVSNNIQQIKFYTKTYSWFSSWGSFSSLKYDFVLGQPDLITSIDATMSAGSANIDLDQTHLDKFLFDASAGSADIKLSKSNVDDMEVKISAGSVNITLDEKSIPDNSVKIDISAGNMVIYIPEGVGVVIDHQISAGTVDVNGKGLTRSGIYKSDNFEVGDKFLQLDVDVSAGKLEIRNMKKILL